LVRQHANRSALGAQRESESCDERRDERFKKLCVDMDAAGKLIGTICHGPWLLISAKILTGRKLTCFVAIKDDVENAGAEWVDEEVVVDRNLVTSRVPNDLPAFMKALIQLANAPATAE
jgi:protease I